ncbi:hypothetical protein C2845_PM17G10210 [Panicum miliaceum]|uniref:Uncharacterized protein n=1 Tax=Panicum miliaceum TaxID=4540 RepID=A0A3L6Q1D0_PANMI|nr:hypothetical protein C2845_PM17G10210 [Panicum miliaceum]
MTEPALGISFTRENMKRARMALARRHPLRRLARLRRLLLRHPPQGQRQEVLGAATYS